MVTFFVSSSPKTDYPTGTVARAEGEKQTRMAPGVVVPATSDIAAEESAHVHTAFAIADIES